MNTQDNTLQFVTGVQKRGNRYGVEVPHKLYEAGKALHGVKCIVTLTPILKDDDSYRACLVNSSARNKK